jgi:cystathionine beta-lyase
VKNETKIILAGRHPEDHIGAVNTPVYHASTILYPSLAAIRGDEPMD